MPRISALSSQSFIAQGTPFDSGFVTNGDFNDPIGTFLNPWTTSSFDGGSERPTRNANNQVEFINNCVLTQTFSVFPNQNMQLRLSFYVYDVINTNGNQVYVNYNTSGITEQRTFINQTGLVSIIVNHGTAGSGTIEFRCTFDPANILVIDKVKAELV